jgi:hypothetical protein
LAHATRPDDCAARMDTYDSVEERYGSGEKAAVSSYDE